MNRKQFWAAMYLRLSRDDNAAKSGMAGRADSLKFESNSIGNQRELIRTFIREQQDMELYDSYVDDGYSGSNFDRPEFKRMIRDVEAGKVNCVIVKDLSRFGRDYIESGRYIQKIFPDLGVRFIALTDCYDSFKADAGESGIVLPIKNFINDSYCRDISMKVKSQLGVKRKNGECIAPFALYGYKKAENSRNQLIVDAYAAKIVQKIFDWRLEGLAVSAIADKLNELGVLSPREYKKSVGINYKGGFSGAVKSRWSSATVKRILTNEMYLGHMVQGKTEKINYKVKKRVEKPKRDWIKVENTHEPIISQDSFQIVRNLFLSDGRVSPTLGKSSLFTGILFCGDCGERMIRRINRYQNTQEVYEICSTKNRGEGCSRHSIPEKQLTALVEETVRVYANCFMKGGRLRVKALEMRTDDSLLVPYEGECARLKEEQEKYRSLSSCLYEDLKEGILTREEFERLHREFKRKGAELAKACSRQEWMIGELQKNRIASEEKLKAMQSCAELKEIDRYTLCSMVKRILVFENHRIEVEFYVTDKYRTIRRETDKAFF